MAAAKNAQLRLTQLVLDGENPRHDAIDDEPDIIAKLLAREKVVKLAQHIVAAGGAKSTRAHRRDEASESCRQVHRA